MPGNNNSLLFLVYCSLGIFLSYFIYGVLQETITKTKYGSQREEFIFIKPTLFIQCVVNTVFAYVVLKFRPESKAKITSRDYAVCAVSYIGAMFCSNASLRFVNYPTQVVGKSVKPIPVMILSVIWARKRYPFEKYLFVGMITAGVILFMKKGDGLPKIADNNGLGWGHLLLLISLGLDGFTGGMQEDFRSRTQVGPYSLMFNLNKWALIYLAVAIIFTGELVPFLLFIEKYPYALLNIVLFGVVSAFGQMFIYTTVVNFGSLMCCIVTTTRKFFTVLTSVVLFGHTLSWLQVMGATLVFTGLLADQILCRKQHIQRPSSPLPQATVLSPACSRPKRE